MHFLLQCQAVNPSQFIVGQLLSSRRVSNPVNFSYRRPYRMDATSIFRHVLILPIKNPPHPFRTDPFGSHYISKISTN